MNNYNIGKLNEYQLIKMILIPKMIQHDHNLCCQFMSSLPKNLVDYEKYLMKQTKSELINLLIDKMDSKPIIKLKDGNYQVYEYLPDSNIIVIYNDGFITYEEYLNAYTQSFKK